MAELHIIGQIERAFDFEEPNLFCKWSLQFGSNWKCVEGAVEGKTVTSRDRCETQSVFSHPIDVHLVSRGIQGWPKVHLEVYAVNAAQHCWPVGFGFAHIPTKPGFHRLDVKTWKLAPNSIVDSLHSRFNTAGLTVAKSDLIFSGSERYKMSTLSSGKVTFEFMLIAKNFDKFGVTFD